MNTDSYFYKICPNFSQIFSEISHHSNKSFMEDFLKTPHNLIKIDSKFRRNILTMFKIFPNLEISSVIFSTFLNFSKISSNSIQNFCKNYQNFFSKIQAFQISYSNKIQFNVIRIFPKFPSNFVKIKYFKNSILPRNFYIIFPEFFRFL